MAGRGAAAAADDVQAVLAHEVADLLGEGLGLQGEDGLAFDQQRQAGVREQADLTGPVFGEVLDVLGHLGRPGGAVHAQAEDGEVAQRRDHAGDVGAHQRGAELLDGDLHHDGHVAATVDVGRQAALGQHVEAGTDSALDLQDVLAGFEQQHVGPAVQQPADLGGVAGEHGVPVDVAQRDQLGARAEAADDESWAVRRGELVAGFSGRLGGQHVQLVHAVDQVLVFHGVQLGVEAVGLDGVAAGGEEALVDLLNDLGPGEQQHLGAVLAAEVVAVEVQVVALVDGRAHRAVQKQDAAVHFFDEAAHGRCFGVGGKSERAGRRSIRSSGWKDG